MKYILGVLFILAGVVLGFYVGFYILFIGGIVAVVDGAKANPTDAGRIAFGLVRIFCASAVGGIIFWACAGVGAACFGWGETTRRRRYGGSAKEVDARWRDVTRGQ